VEIKLKCNCGQVLKVGEEAAGRSGTCPACGSPIRIPTLEEIEQFRVQQAPPVAPAELQLEEEVAEEKAAEEAPKKPGTSRFKAPVRSKTHTKLRPKTRAGEAKEEEEDRSEKKTRIRHAEKGKKKGKTHGKTRVRGKTSVLSKYKRGGSEDEEGGYAPQKKSPVKILIVIGIILVGGLIGLYAGVWAPKGKARKRTQEYMDQMKVFIGDVRDKVVDKYERMVPARVDMYKNTLQELEEQAQRVRDALSPRMASAYDADDIMERTLKVLKGATSIVEERYGAEREGRYNEDVKRDLEKRFGAEVNKANVNVADIEKLINSVADNMR
jgi:hypothetical protein